MTADPTSADRLDDLIPPEERSRPEVLGIDHVEGDARNVFVGNSGPMTVNEAIHHWNFPPRRVRRGPVLLARADEGQLQQLFVTPHGWPEALEELRREGTVLITGAPRTGRRTAGWRLLTAVSDDESREVQTINPESDERELPFDHEEIVAGDRLLVDLSALDGTAYARAEDALGGYLAAVVRRRAVAVVLMPSDMRVVRSELRRRTRTIHRPDGSQVLLRHFDYYRLPAPDTNRENLRTVVQEYGIGELAELAELAVVAHQRAPGPGWAWLDDAVAAVRNRDGDAEKLVRSTAADPEQRALLMAAALLDGAYTETVASAAVRLLDIVSPDRERTPAFTAVGLGERLSPFGARIDEGGRVHFTGLDTAASVRTHFWTHYPGAHAQFRDWVLRCSPVLVAEGIDAPDIVRRFVDQHLRVRRRNDVFDVVREWAENRRAVVTYLASAALAHGLTDPNHGWAFRRRCYVWATAGAGSRISSRLADLVVAACREVINGTHPEQAIVRLRYLAAHRDERVASNAREAMAAVVGRSPDRLRYLLSRLEGGTTGQQRRADTRSFLAAVDPTHLVAGSARPATALIERHDVRSRVVERWQDAWAFGVDGWEAPLHRWLAAATADDRILVAVAEASGGQWDRLRNLEAAAGRWAAVRGDSFARDLFDRFVAILDAAFVAQALRSTDQPSSAPPSGSHPSGDQS
jgi:hypothetical protein